MTHRFRVSALPEAVRGWLDETRSPSATFFPKHPSPGFALGITLLVSVPVIVLMSSVTTAPEDLAAGGVALLILCVSVAWWMRERSRAQACEQGRLRLGMFVGDDGVMWRYRPGEAWFFTWDEVAGVDVDVKFSGKRHSAGNFVVRTRDGEAFAVGRADDFVLRDVRDALVARGLPFRADALLKIPPAPAPAPEAAPGTGRGPRWEPTPFSGSAEQYFRTLCERDGIALVETRPFATVGASSGSIDTPSVTRMSRPPRVRLSELLRLYTQLIPRDQSWLDAARLAAGDTDPLMTVQRISFDLSDYET